MPRYRIVPKTPLRASQRREETARLVDIHYEENYYRGARGQFQRCDFTIARCSKCHRLSYSPLVWTPTLHPYCDWCGRKMVNSNVHQD